MAAKARLQAPQGHVHRVDVAAVAVEHQDALIAVFQQRRQQIAQHVYMGIHLRRQRGAEAQMVRRGAEPQRRQQQHLIRQAALDAVGDAA